VKEVVTVKRETIDANGSPKITNPCLSYSPFRSRQLQRPYCSVADSSMPSMCETIRVSCSIGYLCGGGCSDIGFPRACFTQYSTDQRNAHIPAKGHGTEIRRAEKPKNASEMKKTLAKTHCLFCCRLCLASIINGEVRRDGTLIPSLSPRLPFISRMPLILLRAYPNNLETW
jgi:hypothetical protein